MKSVVESHFDELADNYDLYKQKNKYYYDNLKELLKKLIPQDNKVFEIGCGTGDLLASLKPKFGYGMDISDQMIQKSKSKYKSNRDLVFSTKWPNERFDHIFMSDVIEHLEKPEETFQKISTLMDSKSKFIITMANPIWEPLLIIWEKLGWKMPEGPHNRLSADNLKLIIKNSKLKIIKHDYRLLIPIKTPLLTNFANKYLEKYFRRFAFIEYFVVVKS